MSLGIANLQTSKRAVGLAKILPEEPAEGKMIDTRFLGPDPLLKAKDDAGEMACMINPPPEPKSEPVTVTIDMTAAMPELLANPKFTPKLKIFYEYPQFAKDLSLLKNHGYVDDRNNGYKWLKSKVSLSEYFGHQKKTAQWKIIEDLFDEKDLKNSFSSNGNAYGKKKPSKDYTYLLEILNTPQS
jgi:hypothetical protein